VGARLRGVFAPPPPPSPSSPYQPDKSRPSPRTKWTRRVPHPVPRLMAGKQRVAQSLWGRLGTLARQGAPPPLLLPPPVALPYSALQGGGGRTRRRWYRAAPGARAWPRGASGRCRRSLPRPAHKHPRSIHHRDRPRQPARSGRRRARRAPRRAGGGAPRYFGRGELSLSTGRVVSSKCAISGDRAARPGRAEGARRRVRAAHLFDKDVRDREVRLRGSPRSAA
jgi:hypothetical protein